MRIGLFAPTAAPDASSGTLRALAEAAEEGGFASLWVAEHVVTSVDRPVGGRPDSGLLDPFAALAFLAALTTSVRLGTGVSLIAQRQPVFTAKEAATVDVLSDGRLDLGVGTGWVPEEFAAVGVRRSERGRLLDRNLDVMRTLWVDDVSTHGAILPPCRAHPKPIQRPHPPIHVGGTSDAALRRVASRGQGWYAFSLDPDELAARLLDLDDLLVAEGRTRRDILVTVCDPRHPVDVDLMRRYRHAGADQIVLMGGALGGDEIGPTLRAWARHLVAPAAQI